MGTIVAASAGGVSIAGGLKAVTLSPDLNDKYTQYTGTAGPIFAGGETLTLSAAGADVPAFSATFAGLALQLTQPSTGSSRRGRSIAAPTSRSPGHTRALARCWS